MSLRSNRRAAWALALALPAAGAFAQTPLPGPAAPVAIDPGKPQRPLTALSAVQPVYPRDQACLRIQGTTRLIVTVGADNGVAEVEIERSSGSAELDRAAAQAVRRARWQAEIVNGEPVAASLPLAIEFVSDDEPREYCRRVEITLFGDDGEDVIPVSAEPIEMRVELFVPAALEARWQLRRLGVPSQGESLLHEERRTLQRPDNERRSSFDATVPRPPGPGRYALDVLIDGEQRAHHEFEVR
ncbi:energy transducer TonB [Lysobacter sp. cf310]|uniref:energy transducer TonB n=1 Tax=Lysobacter sp. cf310 TaxID=1761790 RepID=UPI0008EDF556|nr:energy transducer TonB [Lysobacter sp. cf310]SFK96637.1 TonB family C-terminal domain-containing protein [Lysobacter sp. cf310]